MVLSRLDIATWCLTWSIAATVAAAGGLLVHRRPKQSIMVAAVAVAWVGLWFHELIRVPRLLGFTPDGDFHMATRRLRHVADCLGASVLVAPPG